MVIIHFWGSYLDLFRLNHLALARWFFSTEEQSGQCHLLNHISLAVKTVKIVDHGLCAFSTCIFFRNA